MNSKPMYFKGAFSKFAGVASMAVVITSCASIPSGIPIIGAAEPITNSISGREGIDGPVLAVKVDDTRAAHPQAGLEDADLVYIEQVEGGLTRLAAIFSSEIPSRVGPVRSARISDIDILAQYGHIAFAYSGAQKKMLPVISAANLQDMGAQRQSPTIYTTDPNRNSPVAMILRADLLMRKLVDDGATVDIAKKIGWGFSKNFDQGTEISKAKISWPASSYTAEWSDAQSRWLLSIGDVADVSESGVRLGPTTLVIQIVRISPSIYGDKFGGVTPLSETVGQGTGFILRNGKYIAANWFRPTSLDGTTWTDSLGKEIPFAPGQIWVALTDKQPTFTPVLPDATSSASK